MNDDTPPEDVQCEYGTAKAGTVGYERCERDADRTYLDMSETIHLCQEHYDEFHRGDYYSVMR